MVGGGLLWGNEREEGVGIYKGKQGCWIKKCEQCVTEGYGNKVQVGFFHLCRFLFRKRKNK